MEENKKTMKEIMNPIPEEEFNPDTFDPIMPDIKPVRKRVDPPRILPTKGLKPKQLLRGQMIGMYESKQDLYLLIAWLSKRVTALEDMLKKTDEL